MKFSDVLENWDAFTDEGKLEHLTRLMQMYIDAANSTDKINSDNAKWALRLIINAAAYREETGQI